MGGMPLEISSRIVLPLDVEPVGSVEATLPCGQADGTWLSATETPKPAPLSTFVASRTDLQVRPPGMPTFLPWIRLDRVGLVNSIFCSPFIASRMVYVTAGIVLPPWIDE